VTDIPTLSDGERQALLAEYQANVSLWQHDDVLRQQRTTTFLAINTVLITAVAAMTALEAPLRYLGLAAVGLSIFGIAICRVWKIVHVRNRDYARFRRLQLQSIEARLPGGLTTFRLTNEAFEKKAPITFPFTAASFTIAERARTSSAATEERLPVLLGILWLTIGAVGAIVAWVGATP
jgi:hypothetical protein